MYLKFHLKNAIIHLLTKEVGENPTRARRRDANNCFSTRCRNREKAIENYLEKAKNSCSVEIFCKQKTFIIYCERRYEGNKNLRRIQINENDKF